MVRSALGAGKKTTTSGVAGLGKSSLEPLEKIAQALPNKGNTTSWVGHVKKDNAAAYRIPEGVEDALSVPGYVQIQKGKTRYLVKKSVAAGYSKQNKLTRIT